MGLTEARAASPRCVYTASLARLHALGNISTSRLTAPSLALSPPQFMRVGAVAVGLGYGAVMGTFTGLVRHALASPPPRRRILGCSPSRARGPPTDRREGPRDDSRVSQRSSLRKSRRGRIRPLTSPSLPDLSPRAVQKISTAAVDVPARAVPAAAAGHRLGGDAHATLPRALHNCRRGADPECCV